MDIGNTRGVGGPDRIEGPRGPSRIPPPQTPSATPADKVDISDRAHLISEALSLPAVREERIDEIRALVESGRFDTDARLEGAIDRFLQENRDLLE